MNIKSFAQTKNMFDAACQHKVDASTTWKEWMNLDPDLRAAALFVIFYQQISLARVKAYAEFVSDEDAVSDVVTKLLFITPKVEADSALFTPAYIYTVIYKALLEPLRIKRNQWLYSGKIETPDDLSDEGLDPYTNIPDPRGDLDDAVDRREILRVLQSLTDEQRAAVDGLLDRTAVGKNRAERKAIIAELRRIFEDFDDDPAPMTFAKVFARDDDVECADVIMPDGEIAEYYGESYMKNGSLRIRFYGAHRDYDFCYKKAQHFKVAGVEYY